MRFFLIVSLLATATLVLWVRTGIGRPLPWVWRRKPGALFTDPAVKREDVASAEAKSIRLACAMSIVRWHTTAIVGRCC
jgi:hypothetical protein